MGNKTTKKAVSFYMRILGTFPEIIKEDGSYINDGTLVLRLDTYQMDTLYITPVSNMTSLSTTRRRSFLENKWNIKVEDAFGLGAKDLPITPHNASGDGPLTKDEILDRLDNLHSYISHFQQ